MTRADDQRIADGDARSAKTRVCAALRWRSMIESQRIRGPVTVRFASPSAGSVAAITPCVINGKRYHLIHDQGLR